MSRRGFGRFRLEMHLSNTVSTDCGNKGLTRNVYCALNDLFRAYSVFQPALTDSCSLFQVVFLQSSPEERHRSPRETTSNLKTMLERENEFLLPAGSADCVLGKKHNPSIQNAFLQEFQLTSGLSSFGGTSEDCSAFLSVTEGSLIRAGVTMPLIPPIGAGIGVVREVNVSRTLKISDLQAERYTGGGRLKTLIWNHIDIVFPMILAEAEDEFGSEVGDKKMMAIVTKRIIANIDVSSSSTRSYKAGAFSKVPTTSLSAGAEGSWSFDSCNHLSGVSGLHMIELPVEKKAYNKYRVFRPIDICNAEEEDEDSVSEASRSKFIDSVRWHRGNQSLQHDSMDVSANTSPNNSINRSESEGSTYSRSTARTIPGSVESEWNQEEWKDVPSHFSKLWMDIDVEPLLEKIAHRQCTIAGGYLQEQRSVKEGRKCVRLLRSAIIKCRYGSLERPLTFLASCYEVGFGVLRNVKVARKLRRCASVSSRIKDMPAGSWYLVPRSSSLRTVETSMVEDMVCYAPGLSPFYYVLGLSTLRPRDFGRIDSDRRRSLPSGQDRNYGLEVDMKKTGESAPHGARDRQTGNHQAVACTAVSASEKDIELDINETRKSAVHDTQCRQKRKLPVVSYSGGISIEELEKHMNKFRAEMKDTEKRLIELDGLLMETKAKKVQNLRRRQERADLLAAPEMLTENEENDNKNQ